MSITLIRHGPTSATRRAAFALDEDLDQRGRRGAERLAGVLGPFAAVWSGPARSALATAAALRLTPRVAAELDECDHGTWRGRTLEQLYGQEPLAVRRWLGDPTAAPHGGESIVDLLARVAAWLDARAGEPGPILAITHAGVIRAAALHALGAPASAFWRIDVAPLSRTILRARGGGWTVGAINIGSVRYAPRIE